MKPSTNRRERRAGFLAGLAGTCSAPKFRTRAQRRAWWNGYEWSRSVTMHVPSGVSYVFAGLDGGRAWLLGVFGISADEARHVFAAVGL